MQNLYKEHGYKSRSDYLESLANEYDVDLEIVNALADMLGEDEDFDGLVATLQDSITGF